VDGTVGLEEELMLLDPETLDLTPRATEVLAATGGDSRFKLELPAAQLEIVTAPAATVAEAASELAAARRALSAAASGLARPAGSGVHPTASGVGVLNTGDRYDGIGAEYGPIARRQLVFGLHVHVAVAGAGRALAVYNALRSHLPEIAALAANAPFYEGRDTGLCSVRPKLSELLPRQGVPPPLESWEAFAAELAWGAAAARVPEPRQWWWELRPHPTFGTIEVRVPDTQSTVADSAAVAAVVHALAFHLTERHDAGDLPAVAPSWRIEENRWSACRHGLDGALADLHTGRRVPTRERLAALLGVLAPTGRRLGCEAELAHAGELLEDGNGAARQRAVAAERGLPGLLGWLADAFAPAVPA
jgi:carboxylate-amine ligase